MAWYKRKEDEGIASEKRSVPAGVFTKCPSCRESLVTTELTDNAYVCGNCDHHFRMPTRSRIDSLFDAYEEVDAGLTSVDPLAFKDSKRYVDRVAGSRKKTGINDALVAVRGTMDGVEVEAGFFAFEFMGGSMGSVVGEKVTRVYERALARKVPALIFTASGGARMQEGVISLMQMAKTSAAISRLREANVPQISVLLDPTTGGVAASFAMLGDLNISEPNAQIGFAGARVIQNTIRQELPPGFQSAEFLVEHGFVDRIVHRHDMKATLANLCRYMGAQGG